MDVIILAGGLGTRLRSVVSEVPKCMAPVLSKPFLWYLLTYLKQYDEIRHVVLSVGYLREAIFSWIDDIKGDFPFVIDYAVESTPLGTGGGIRLALSNTFSEDVFVLNGDTFFNANLMELYKQHRCYSSAITLALKPMADFSRYGNIQVNSATHQIESFNEKEYCVNGLINGGIYIINRNTPLFEAVPEKFSFETEILQPQTLVGNVYGFVDDSYFIDIGIPEDYYRANNEFEKLFNL